MRRRLRSHRRSLPCRTIRASRRHRDPRPHRNRPDLRRRHWRLRQLPRPLRLLRPQHPLRLRRLPPRHRQLRLRHPPRRRPHRHHRCHRLRHHRRHRHRGRKRMAARPRRRAQAPKRECRCAASAGSAGSVRSGSANSPPSPAWVAHGKPRCAVRFRAGGELLRYAAASCRNGARARALPSDRKRPG